MSRCFSVLLFRTSFLFPAKRMFYLGINVQFTDARNRREIINLRLLRWSFNVCLRFTPCSLVSTVLD